MADIVELERRITSALERIGAGVERLEPPRPEDDGAKIDPEEFARISEALESERATNAQLEERLRSLKAQLDDEGGRLRQEVERMRGETGELAERNRLLKARLEAATGTLEKVRAAAQGAGLGAGEIDRVAHAELDALKAMREAERAELDELLAALEPLVEEAAHA